MRRRPFSAVVDNDRAGGRSRTTSFDAVVGASAIARGLRARAGSVGGEFYDVVPEHHASSPSSSKSSPPMSGNVAGRRHLILPSAKFGDRSEELLKRVASSKENSELSADSGETPGMRPTPLR